MSNFKFGRCMDGKHEVVTNLPRSDVKLALDSGFQVVDAATWRPINYPENQIADLFFNGVIDLIREVEKEEEQMEDKKMHLNERAQMVRAMETLVRSVNNEDFIDSWLICGVADEDIKPSTTDEDLECYCEDENFQDLMTLFLKIMKWAIKDGGIQCDGIVSR